MKKTGISFPRAETPNKNTVTSKALYKFFKSSTPLLLHSQTGLNQSQSLPDFARYTQEQRDIILETLNNMYQDVNIRQLFDDIEKLKDDGTEGKI